MPTTPMAIIALKMPGPRADVIAKASINEGNVQIASVTRINNASVFPPTKPATMPSSTPEINPILTETKPTASDTRAP
jgi:hypothetical protein